MEKKELPKEDILEVLYFYGEYGESLSYSDYKLVYKIFIEHIEKKIFTIN